MLSKDERYILHSMDEIILKAQNRGYRVVRFMVQYAAWTRLLAIVDENFAPDASAVGPENYRGIPLEFHNGNVRKLYFREA